MTDHTKIPTPTRETPLTEISITVKGFDFNAARVTALLEKALLEEIAQIPPAQRADSEVIVGFKFDKLAEKGMDDYTDQHQSYLDMRQSEPKMMDVRPLRVKVTIK